MADVNSIQTSSQTLMSQQYAAVLQFLNALQGFITQDTIEVPDSPDVSALFVDEGAVSSAMDALSGSVPAYAPNTETVAPVPPPEPVNVTDVPVDNPPEFSDTAPSPDIPSAPDAALPSAPNAPGIAGVSAPSAPQISVPPPPSFQPIALPDAAEINLEVFSFPTPVSDLTAPTATFQFNEQDYTSALSDAVKAKLIYDIENGGYGIDTSDEKALWDRARERASAEANAVVEEALNAAASRGFPLPPGADMAIVADAQRKALANISGVDREIALKRADMYVENRKVTIQLANEVEQLFINYRSSMMERSLNAAKAIVELGIAIFNAKRDKFLADLEAFKSYAQVYEMKIRAELAKVEIFKARVEAARVSAEIQATSAQVYKTQVEALQANIEIYKGQIEGAKLAFQLEHGKLEIFQAQVQAYTAQVQAKTAQFDMYKSQIEGARAQIDVFDAKVRAYNSRVQGFDAKVRALVGRAQAQATAATAKTQRYLAQVEQYRADLQRIITNTNANVEVFRGQTAGYLGRAGAIEKAAELGISANEANSRAHAKLIDQNITVVQQRTADLLHLLDSRINAAKAGVDSTTQLAVAAAQQITGLTSLLATA